MSLQLTAATAVRTAHRVSNARHAAVRRFRNMLLVATVGSAVVVVLVGVLGANQPQLFPVCAPRACPAGAVGPTTGSDSAGSAVQSHAEPVPAVLDSTAAATETPSTVAVSPGSADTALVMLYGSLGALLALVLTLTTMSRPTTPYSLNGLQLMLKLPVGALVALLGMVLLHSGVVQGITAPETQAGLLFYAIAFGYSQQLATHFIDQKANGLLTSAQPANAGTT